MTGSKQQSVLRFVAFTTLCAIGYGILHDLVTAHVSVDYFTVHHPRIIASENPIVLALLWGVIATWWVGLPLGFVIALSNVLGKRAQIDWRILRKRVVVALIAILLIAYLIVAVIYLVAGNIPAEHRSLTFENDRRLVAVASAHLWSYNAGALAGIFLAAWTWLARRFVTLGT